MKRHVVAVKLYVPSSETNARHTYVTRVLCGDDVLEVSQLDSTSLKIAKQSAEALFESITIPTSPVMFRLMGEIEQEVIDFIDGRPFQIEVGRGQFNAYGQPIRDGEVVLSLEWSEPWMAAEGRG